MERTWQMVSQRQPVRGTLDGEAGCENQDPTGIRQEQAVVPDSISSQK